MEITFVTDEAGIARCYPLMSQLRPHLSREAFLAAVRRMEAAQRLGIGRNTITRKIQELGLEAPDEA